MDRSQEELNQELNALYGSTRRAEQKVALTSERSEPLTIVEALQVTSPVKVQTKIAQDFPQALDEPKIEDQLGVPDYVVAMKYER